MKFLHVQIIKFRRVKYPTVTKSLKKISNRKKSKKLYFAHQDFKIRSCEEYPKNQLATFN